MKFFVMIGIPGSGKSTKALELSKKYNAEIFSSDKIAFEMYGHNNINNGKEVFKEMNRRIEEALKDGKNVIFDSTNTKIPARNRRIELAKKYKCEKIGVWMKTDFKECYKRNRARERKVPGWRIAQIINSFQEPTLEEGFDEIMIFE